MRGGSRPARRLIALPREDGVRILNSLTLVILVPYFKNKAAILIRVVSK